MIAPMVKPSTITFGIIAKDTSTGKKSLNRIGKNCWKPIPNRVPSKLPKNPIKMI